MRYIKRRDMEQIGPLIKINDVTHLQDARYCAAVGVDIIGFNLTRGDIRKLSPEAIDEMYGWLEIPAVCIASDRESLDEVQTLKKTRYDYLSLPIGEWKPEGYDKRLSYILRSDTLTEPTELSAILVEAREKAYTVYFELLFAHVMQLHAYFPLFKYLFVQFDSFQPIYELLEGSGAMPKGITLGQAAEESLGMLNYDAIDDLLATFREAAY